MLGHSIRAIRAHVDYVNVVIQREGWFGGGASPSLDSTLHELSASGLIDRIIEYPFDASSASGSDRTAHALAKKNVGVRDLIKAGCTHCLIMDVDELYDPDEFLAARNRIYTEGITHSACGMYDYTISPIYRRRDLARYAVPFIFALSPRSCVSSDHRMPCRVDPLRSFRFNRLVHKFWYFNDITMHHMTGIRADYGVKMANTITNSTPAGREFVQRWWDNHEALEQLSEDELLTHRDALGGYIKVDDKFGILHKEM